MLNNDTSLVHYQDMIINAETSNVNIIPMLLFTHHDYRTVDLEVQMDTLNSGPFILQIIKGTAFAFAINVDNTIV